MSFSAIHEFAKVASVDSVYDIYEMADKLGGSPERAMRRHRENQSSVSKALTERRLATLTENRRIAAAKEAPSNRPTGEVSRPPARPSANSSGGGGYTPGPARTPPSTPAREIGRFPARRSANTLPDGYRGSSPAFRTGGWGGQPNTAQRARTTIEEAAKHIPEAAAHIPEAAKHIPEAAKQPGALRRAAEQLMEHKGKAALGLAASGAGVYALNRYRRSRQNEQ